MKSLTKEQNQKISSAYGDKFTKIEDRAAKSDESRINIYIDAFQLAERVSKKFSVGVGIIFSVFLPSLDATTAKQIEACRISPDHSHLFNRDIRAKFSKIRFTGYMVSAKREMLMKPDELLPDINGTGIKVHVYDLGLKEFKAALNGNNTNEADLSESLDKVINKIENTDKHLIVSSRDRIEKIIDLYKKAIDAVNLEIEKKATLENEKAYKSFSTKMKKVGLTAAQINKAFIATGGRVPAKK